MSAATAAEAGTADGGKVSVSTAAGAITGLGPGTVDTRPVLFDATRQFVEALAEAV